MSEFKFPCPACGQDVSGNVAQAGTEIACPACQAGIIVPDESTADAGALPPDSPPAFTGYNATTATPRTSRLAIASLAFSLSSLITCVGWLPGIICGHLAQSRLRRDSSLKGDGLARAGLIIGYSFILLEVAVAGIHIWRFSAAVKQGFEHVRQDLATNHVLITETQFTNVSNDGQPVPAARPAVVVTNTPPPGTTSSGWLADITQAAFPDHPASGKLHGLDFAFKSALFRNGTLRINSTNGVYLDIMHGLGASIEGQSYEIRSDNDDSTNLHVKMVWHEDDAIQSATFTKGFGLKIQFGTAAKRMVPAKIYVCFPDDAKSYVAGTFKVRISRPR